MFNLRTTSERPVANGENSFVAPTNFGVVMALLQSQLYLDEMKTLTELEIGSVEL